MEFIYKAVTHAMLGIITFLAVEIYNFVKSTYTMIESHEIRISIIEDRLHIERK